MNENIKQTLKTHKIYKYQFFECLQTLGEDLLGVVILAYSPDGHTIASGGYDMTIRIWDIVTGKVVCTFDNKLSKVCTLAFSSDGQTLFSNDGNDIKIWDLQNKQEIGRLKGHSEGVVSLAVSSDGSLISGSYDTTIKVWNEPRSGQYYTLGEHPCPRLWPGNERNNPVKIALSSNGATLISGSAMDRWLEIWDWKQKKQIGLLKDEKFDSSDCIVALAISPEGKTAIGAGKHGIDVWDLQTQTKLYNNHSIINQWSEILSVAVSLDSCILFCGMMNDFKKVRVIDLATGNEVYAFPIESVCSVDSITISPDGQKIAITNSDTIEIWGIPDANK